MPKFTQRQRAGFRAETFVGKFVSDAGHVWNDTHRDFAIDGQIEFVTGEELTGFAVDVQVKGTEVGFPGENKDRFRFKCEADHVDFWLRRGRPVVLICVNLPRQLAWWKRVDTWFADPVHKARRVVEFDKHADRLDLAALSVLASFGVPRGQPLPRLAATESLVSNLLEVQGFTPLIYEASTPCRDRADAWERMRLHGAFEGGFVLDSGRIYSMRSLEDSPLSVLCDGPISSTPTEKWSMTQDEDQLRRFVALLNFTLRSAHHQDLVWHPRKKIVYYQAAPNLSARKIRGRYKQARGRTFFSPHFGKDETTKVSFCRHYAAALYFRRWSGRWYLEINPTYHFTIDGRRDSLYDAEYVQKIKRKERNNAVYQLVRAWADYLQGEDTLFATRDERILFGKLLAIEADAAIDERAWIPPADDHLDRAEGSLVAGLWEVSS